MKIALAVLALTFPFWPPELWGERMPPVVRKSAAIPPLDFTKVPNFIFVPIHRQEENYTCGLGAMRSLLHYYGDYLEESELRPLLRPNAIQGTTIAAITALLKKLAYVFEVREKMTTQDLREAIGQKHPVLVTLQAWTDQKNVDWKTDWNDGHYALVIGFDDKNFYFMDPSNPGKYAYIPEAEFLVRWHDIDRRKRLEQWGLIAYKPPPIATPTASPTSESYNPIDKME